MENTIVMDMLLFLPAVSFLENMWGQTDVYQNIFYIPVVNIIV